MWTFTWSPRLGFRFSRQRGVVDFELPSLYHSVDNNNSINNVDNNNSVNNELKLVSQFSVEKRCTLYIGTELKYGLYFKEIIHVHKFGIISK